MVCKSTVSCPALLYVSDTLVEENRIDHKHGLKRMAIYFYMLLLSLLVLSVHVHALCAAHMDRQC